jgi:tetratricopeptide (TPR) repeat protein/transcriptional regulator with XRE-family HTH domain
VAAAADVGSPILHASADEVKVLIGLFCLLRNSTHAGLAAAATLHPSTVSRYVRGTSRPEPRELEKLANAAAVPLWAVEGVLMPVIALAQSVLMRRDLPAPGSWRQVAANALAREPCAAARAAISEYMARHELPLDGEHSAIPGIPRPLEKEAWELLLDQATSFVGSPLSLGGIETLTIGLCSESLRAAAADAARAVELARRALRMAELATGEGPGLRLQGYAWAFVGNAKRVASDFPAADSCFATAWRLWRAGNGSGEPSGLCEWRLLDLEASLRRDQRNFDSALALHERALAASTPADRGRILLNKGATLEQSGRYEAALAVLDDATPLIGAGEPHQAWTAGMNRLVVYCHLGRFIEAQAGLAKLCELACRSGNDLDELRTHWLAGRVAQSLGHKDEALTIFQRVRLEFTKRAMAFDAALVTLELAILHLEAGRSAEVQTLAAEMLWIFSSRKVQREALAALNLFRRAAEDTTATVALVQRVHATLERATRAVAGSSVRRSS